MAGKTINCTISPDLVPTRPDTLLSDCLRIECPGKVVLHPGTQSRVNLSVHNTASDGRMGQVIANFDPRQVTVTVPTAGVYVAPGGKTTVFAIVTAVAATGQASITFDVF